MFRQNKGSVQRFHTPITLIKGEESVQQLCIGGVIYSEHIGSVKEIFDETASVDNSSNYYMLKQC